MEPAQLQAVLRRLFAATKPTDVFRTRQVRSLIENLTDETLTDAQIRAGLYALDGFAHPRPARAPDGLAWTFGFTTPTPSAPAPAAPVRPKRVYRPGAEKPIAATQRLKR